MSDYINRYAVLNVINDAIANNALSYESCVNEIMEFIAKIPAADVAPVRHGQMTNADRIRSMSDDEMAEFLDDATNCVCFPCTRDINNLEHFEKCKHERGSCEKEWIEWLKREMEGEIING